ncbi:MAG: 3-dehydroquinate synthase [Paludibacteraceae bacterium]|nr:3-dehydroquinate synthase [Paludibacteraceae bacterium]
MKTLVLQDKKVSWKSSFPTLKIKGGESCKNLRNLHRVWDFLLKHNADRNTVLLCVGGGSISDLGGLAASTYLRGIRFSVMPTTVLSMVDASIGGKTGIDYKGFKNLIGTFQRPYRQSIDTRLLKTLPYEEFLSGMAEVVKTGLLNNEIHFNEALAALEDGQISEDLVLKTRAFKEHIVHLDPKDRNIRHQLNLGHTIGHALEEAGMKWNMPIRHGYAVMQGLVAELYLSMMKTGLDKRIISQLSHILIEYYGKPAYSCKDYQKLIAIMRQDKKNVEGKINFTFLQNIGQPLINQTATDKEIEEALEYLFTL